MATWLRIVVGVLLVAHGLVHLLYLTDDVEEFSIEGSGVVPESIRRPVAMFLMWATVAGFGLLGLVAWGVPGLAGAWSPIAITASALSLVLLVAYWNRSLIFGVLIDVALIAIAAARPEWTDGIGG